MEISGRILKNLLSLTRQCYLSCRSSGFRPDLIHCHDWQTGLIPVYLKTEFAAGEFYRGIKICYDDS